MAPVLKSGRRRQRGAVFQEGLGVSFSFIMERSFYFSHRVSHAMLRVFSFASPSENHPEKVELAIVLIGQKIAEQRASKNIPDF